MPREQFHRGLQDLQDAVLGLGAMVDRQIGRSMRALRTRDVLLAHAVIRDDAEVNRTRFHLDNVCLSLLAQQAPLASDLRLIVAALAVVSELERMGDHAAGIARVVVGMQGEQETSLPDISEMAQQARRMLTDALRAFERRDLDAANAVGLSDAGVDEAYARVYRGLIDTMVRDPDSVEPCTHLLWVAHNLERIADRATNVAERVVFTVTGMQAETDRATAS